MGLIDQNGHPAAKPTNGQQDKTVRDVRAVPTGTLLYNLVRFTGEEVGIENMLHQIEQHKRMQKMVVDPPEVKALREHLQEVTDHRYIVCRELNDRFAEMDKMRLAKLGIEITETTKEE